MKKLENLNNELFENFKDDEINKLQKIIGGQADPCWTDHGNDAVRSSGADRHNDLFETVEPYGALGKQI